MEDWTKVLLYGTYDGFTRSTDGLHRIVVVLEGGERVEIPKEFVVSAEQMVNKNKIKLKDVIARIKSFDVESQKAWLNEILNELGSDYRALIYKDGYEQGKLEGLIEREIVTVPRFVADWYEEHKDDFEIALFRCIDHIPSVYDEGDLNEFEEWIIDGETKPFQTLVNMHQFGYTVEKEPKYTVKCKATKQYLSNDELGPHFDPSFRSNFTKSDLEELGLGWTFDCEGMEVEKV